MGERIVIIGRPEGQAQALGEALAINGLALDYLDDSESLFDELASLSPSIVILSRERLSPNALPELERYRRSIAQRSSLVILDMSGAGTPPSVFDFETSPLALSLSESPPPPSDLLGRLIGNSCAMRRLFHELKRLDAHDDTTVTLLGETGTGKSWIARLIHERSRRAHEPFVTVDCTVLAHSLIESELFGHERGAFSGAISARTGWVEEAGAGTLFLDEVGELPLDLQGKLLGLLETREFSRVGGRRRLPFRARVIAATNRDLPSAVEAGLFRRDLFYRLDVFTLELPPLRERREDILALAYSFIRRRAEELGWSSPPMLSRELEEALLDHSFDGNIRELKNLVELAMTQPAPIHTLDLSDLPRLARTRSRRTSSSPSGGDHLEESADPGEEKSLDHIRESAQEREMEAIAEVLMLAGGNVTKAARLLRISRHQLYRKMQKFGMR